MLGFGMCVFLSALTPNVLPVSPSSIARARSSIRGGMVIGIPGRGLIASHPRATRRCGKKAGAKSVSSDFFLHFQDALFILCIQKKRINLYTFLILLTLTFPNTANKTPKRLPHFSKVSSFTARWPHSSKSERSPPVCEVQIGIAELHKISHTSEIRSLLWH